MRIRTTYHTYFFFAWWLSSLEWQAPEKCMHKGNPWFLNEMGGLIFQNLNFWRTVKNKPVQEWAVRCRLCLKHFYFSKSCHFNHATWVSLSRCVYIHINMTTIIGCRTAILLYISQLYLAPVQLLILSSSLCDRSHIIYIN